MYQLPPGPEALVREGHAANRRGDAAAAQRCFDVAYALNGKPSSSLSAANMVLKQGGPRNAAAAAARYQRLLGRGDLSAAFRGWQESGRQSQASTASSRRCARS